MVFDKVETYNRSMAESRIETLLRAANSSPEHDTLVRAPKAVWKDFAAKFLGTDEEKSE